MKTVTNGKMISSTNKHIESRYKEQEGTITFNNGLLIWQGHSFNNTFHTSLISKVEYKDNSLIAYTVNSIYIFEVAEKLDIKIDDDTKGRVKELQEMNSGEYTKFFCQVTGNHFIDNSMSVVLFEKPMTRQQAMDKVTSEVVLSISGDIVSNILMGVKD